MTVPPEGHAVRTAADFAEFRPLMFSIAYRMTGSISDAEDIVQEAFLRLTRVLRDGTGIDSPKAYLATATTRLAISHLRSARVRRESYVGAWLPEPLVASAEPDPAERAEMSDSLSMAFLVLMESLSPTERAVFLLHEVFGYNHQEIAGIIGKSEANCRQIFLRARRHVDEGKPRFEASREQRDEVARRFFAAASGGDLAGLLELLAPDVVMIGDGGGKAWAAAKPFHGPKQVARFMLGLARRAPKMGARLELAWVNDQPGAITYDTQEPRHQRVRPRHRRRHGAGDQVGDQPRQAPPSRAGLRCGAAGAARLTVSAMATDFTEETAADAVVDSFVQTQDPRLRELLTSLVRHLHAFVRETEPTIAEWERAIEFLTATGQKCDDERQEFILLSDVLGISMLVETINNRKSGGATESTVLGPFHVVKSPRRELGDSIDFVGTGTPCVVRGRVLSPEGTPLPGAELDVWQASDQGFYDVQQPDVQPRANGRGLFTADKDGAFWFRTVVPSHYPIPTDGPVGTLLNATERHPYRPAHIHFIVTAPGYRALTTHIFVAGSPYIESDAVFAVKKSLIKDFTSVDDPEQAARYDFTGSFTIANFNIVLQPTAEN